MVVKLSCYRLTALTVSCYLARLVGESSAGVTVAAVVTGLEGSVATASGTDTTIELVAAIGDAKPYHKCKS